MAYFDHTIGSTGRYCYTEDLLSLNEGFSQPGSVDHRLSVVTTPLRAEEWKKALSKHPDADFARYICDGLKYGFHIGVKGGSFQGAKRNMLSARQNPRVVEEYLQKELTQGNILGPFHASSMPSVQVNRFGCIPKKHQPGKWRLIMDLSYPERGSVNDAINPSLCSLSYISVEKVAKQAMSLGSGTLLAKIDIKSAYRLVPVHPSERKLLGMEWEGKLFVDGMLPFGLRSAPKIFTASADALEWRVAQQGVRYVFHYLDDFVVIGPAGSSECADSLNTLEGVCAQLGVPLAPEKRDGPSSVLIFLGIIIDTVKGELRLPADKLRRLSGAVEEWLGKKWCTRRELESLIGTLQHACSVIRPGRSFLRRAIALLSVAKKPRHHIRLNQRNSSRI